MKKLTLALMLSIATIGTLPFIGVQTISIAKAQNPTNQQIHDYLIEAGFQYVGAIKPKPNTINDFTALGLDHSGIWWNIVVNCTAGGTILGYTQTLH